MFSRIVNVFCDILCVKKGMDIIVKDSNKFIEYYGKHNISPVKQDLSDINVHYARREKLYRQLGIPCIAFNGKKVLEVGPGSGYNTLAFFEWGGICTLVEPNKAGVIEMKKLFADYNVLDEQYAIKECTIEEADIYEKFDIVIAEGFLHSIDNSDEIIRRLSELVKDGGVIVITCMDSISMFVEQMKRLICHILINDISDYEIQVKACVHFFEGQMKNVKGMSRSIEDWVRDDMLNPAFNNEEILSIEDAIDIFPSEFSFLGSSLKIFTDYSWYKDIEYDERKDIIRQYRMKRHNFLMTGLSETIFSEKDSNYFEKKISEIRSFSREYEKTNAIECLDEIEERLCAIRPMMMQIDKKCAVFTDEVKEILDKLKYGQSVEFEKYRTFYSAVGRTQQYLSMVKNKTVWI